MLALFHLLDTPANTQTGAFLISLFYIEANHTITSDGRSMVTVAISTRQEATRCRTWPLQMEVCDNSLDIVNRIEFILVLRCHRHLCWSREWTTHLLEEWHQGLHHFQYSKGNMTYHHHNITPTLTHAHSIYRTQVRCTRLHRLREATK